MDKMTTLEVNMKKVSRFEGILDISVSIAWKLIKISSAICAVIVLFRFSNTLIKYIENQIMINELIFKK